MCATKLTKQKRERRLVQKKILDTYYIFKVIISISCVVGVWHFQPGPRGARRARGTRICPIIMDLQL